MKKAFSFLKNLTTSILPDSHTGAIDTHIKEAIQWLARAQDVMEDDGVSSGYHLYHGWLSSYPETTGYIIETFFKYAKLVQNEEYKVRAIKMTEWLLNVQKESGAIPDMDLKREMVFDTGQAIFGLIETYRETGDEKFIQAAINAGNWLLKVQDKNGSWINNAAFQIPHTYYSRVAWSLAELAEACANKNFREAAVKNIQWCLNQQTANGWFNNASFKQDRHNIPFTHTIAYTLRGILEVGLILNEESYFDSVIKATNILVTKIEKDGFVGGTFDKEWYPDKKFSCLTGNAQFAIILFKQFQKYSKNEYKEVACRINRYLMRRQNISTKNIGIRGAIAGSVPIWGPYIHYNYPNWATKFFIDSLILEKESSNNNTVKMGNEF